MTTDPQGESVAETTIHEAERVGGPSGAVEWGNELTFLEAVERRRQELDVVVRGLEQRKNRYKARAIESAVGTPVVEDQPHPRAGDMALPHWHQESRSPNGHTFYELGNRKAKKRKA